MNVLLGCTCGRTMVASMPLQVTLNMPGPGWEVSVSYPGRDKVIAAHMKRWHKEVM